MLDQLSTPDDVTALRIAGKIDGGDLDAVRDLLDATLKRFAVAHVFVKTRAVTAVAIDDLARYGARAAGLFGKLDRFGRVAVVADQAWIRRASRIESALLPHISYRTFTPARRDEALAWVLDGSAG